VCDPAVPEAVEGVAFETSRPGALVKPFLDRGDAQRENGVSVKNIPGVLLV